MSLFNWLFGGSYETHGETSAPEPRYLVNPASGMPMVDDSIDVAGNLFGTDWTDHAFDHDSGCGHDSWSHDSGCSSSHWD